MAISARELTLILRVQSAGTNNIRRLSGDLRALEHSGMSVRERFVHASQAIGAAGRAMQLVGGIGTAALGFAANEAANLQTSVTLAATQVANNVHKVREVASADFNFILDQMTKFPSKAADMSAALYDIYSTISTTAKGGREILEQVNKAAVAGAITTQDAAQGLLSVFSNFKNFTQDGAGAAQVLNRSFAAVRFGRMTMDQFQKSLSTTAPAAKNAQQSFNTLAGTMAFLTRSLGPAKGAVGFARLTEVLGNSKFLGKMKTMGVQIQDSNGKFLQMDQIITNLTKRFPYLTEGGAKALNFFKEMSGQTGTIQARRAFVTLTTNVKGYKDILNKTTNDNKEFGKSYKAMAESLGIQWATLLNTLKSLAITIGLAVIPAFVQMSKPVIDAIHWFQGLDDGTKGMIGRFAAFAAVGLLVVGTLLTVVSGIVGAVASMAALGGAAAILLTGLAAYTVLAEIGLAIYRNWSDVGPLFEQIAHQLMIVGKAIGEAVKAFTQGNWSEMFSHLGEAVKAAIPAVITALEILKDAIINWFKGFFSHGALNTVIGVGLAGIFTRAMLFNKGGAVAKTAGLLTKGELLGGLADIAGVGLIGGGGATAKMAATKAGNVTEALDKLKSGQTAELRKMLAINALTGTKFTSKQAAILEPLVAMQEAEAKTAGARVRKVFAGFSDNYKQGVRDWKVEQAIAQKDLMRSGKSFGVLQDAKGRFVSAGGATAIAEKTVPTIDRTAVAMIGANAAAGSMASGASKAASSIGKLGKGFLSTVGMGNVWVGAVVAGGVAAYGLSKALQALFPSLGTLVKREKDSAVAFRDASKAAAGSSAAYSTYANRVKDVQLAIKTTQSQLNKTQGGTAKYRSELRLLAGQQRELKDATVGAADAQKQLAENFQGVLNTIKDDKFNESLKVVNQMNSGQFQDKTSTMTTIAGVVQDPMYIDPKTVGDARIAIAAQTDAWKANISTILEAHAAGRKLTDTEMAVQNAMGSLAEQHRGDFPQLAELFNQLNDTAVKFIQTLGTVPQNMAGFAAYADSIPKKLVPAVREFMKITGQSPNAGFVGMLQKLGSPTLAKEMAVFVAETGKLPTNKQIKIAFQRPEYLQRWITTFLEKFHKLPSQKAINIHIKAHDDTQAKLAKIGHHIEVLRRHAADILSHRGGTVPNALQDSIKAAERERDKLAGKKPIHLKGIMQFVVKGNAFKAIPQQATTAAGDAKKAFNSLPTALQGFGTQAGINFSSAFSATAHATAHATITVIVNQFKKVAQITSPSKLFKKEIGDPILQGILEGLKDKASIKDAAGTAVDTMISMFDEKRTAFADQFGALFDTANITEKMDWGEKLNIKDLTKSLQTQEHTFRKFQRGVTRLDRRKGVSSDFAEMLRSMGPEHQKELDALLRATPAQLRKYVNLWKKSQKEISGTAANATRAQFKMWRQQGANVAVGFMLGMQEHRAGMARAFRNIFLSLFNQVKRTHRSHSPSKLYFEEGLNVAKGFRMGVQHGMVNQLSLGHAPVGGWQHRGPQVAHVTNNYHTTYNVYPQRNENILSALRKHDHLTRVHP